MNVVAATGASIAGISTTLQLALRKCIHYMNRAQTFAGTFKSDNYILKSRAIFVQQYLTYNIYFLMERW